MTNASNHDNPLTALSNAMADAAAKAGASTVMVNARRRIPASGVVFTSGFILTANHVVERDENISILGADGVEAPVTIAGRDPGTDLAVLKLDHSALEHADPAPEAARIGHIVLALGRPSPEGIQASFGVISAIGGPVRTGRGGLLERYLATDAIPYPGFSGGPLIDAAGRVIGINTSGLTRGSSLAIPTDLAWQIAKTLIQQGHVRRGYLGIRSQPVELPPQSRQSLNRQQATGLLIVGVEGDSPAENGGLMVGDILIGIAGQPVADPDELLTRLSGDIVGRPTQVEVLRGGTVQTIEIMVGERK